MTARSALIVAALAAIAATAILVALRVGAAATSRLPDPPSMIWVLFAAAALCIAGLSTRRSPSIAWIASVLALTIATLDIAAFGREHRAGMSPEAWHWLVAVTCLGALSAAMAAAAYALEPRRRAARWVVPLTAIVVGIVALAGVWAIATADPLPPAATASPLGTLSVATRTLIVAVAVLLALGILGDLRPAARRTRTRLGQSSAQPASSPRWRRTTETLRTFVDELTPGQARARRATSAERSRIAVELHADVVPAVRRALAEAERGGSAERLADALREVLGELDDLAADRRSVVLEELGLLAAVEQLAERTEERSDVRVTIDVLNAASIAARPPREVEAAAFRVVQLALENVIRHAPTASATIELSVGVAEVALAIADDGPGIVADDGPAAAIGHRGLADMRAEAAACGASLTTTGLVDGRGTVIRFAWPAF